MLSCIAELQSKCCRAGYRLALQSCFTGQFLESYFRAWAADKLQLELTVR